MAIDSTLKKWNADLLKDGGISDVVAPSLQESNWLGLPPATESEITETEERLGVRLPQSYREFLAKANGWAYVGDDMSFPGALRSCAQICWFRDDDADWIEAWKEADTGHRISDEEYFTYGEEQDTVLMKVEYLEHCLKISESSEGGVYLLNPRVTTQNGEWEAWHFSNQLPGATRCRNFEDLIKQQHKLFTYYRDEA